MADKPNRIKDFEKSLGELEGLVEKLEQGDIPLEEALRQFERGVELARSCQGALKEAELKVQKLLEAQGESQLQDYNTEE